MGKMENLSTEEMISKVNDLILFYKITNPNIIEKYNEFSENPSEERLEAIAKSFELDDYLKILYRLFKNAKTKKDLDVCEDLLLNIKISGLCSEETYLLLDELNIYKYLELSSKKNKQKVSEKQYVREIVLGFNEIFPMYNFISTEKTVRNIGRIDIFAEEKETNRPVIIECKKGKHNPAKQLLAYASSFDNPILIGITELPILRPHDSIIYKTYDELFCNQRGVINE